VFFALLAGEPQDRERLNGEVVRLMDLCGKDVLRVAYIYLKDYQRAEDAFQEVFIKVHRNFARFRGTSSERTWIIKITVNVCKDMLRNAWFKKIILFRDPVRSPEDIAEHVAASDRNRRLFDAVLRLDPVFKDVIVLYYYEEFSTQEIAGILGIAEGTVRSRLHRAREQLKRQIEGGIDRFG